jgi:hypothetical protein
MHQEGRNLKTYVILLGLLWKHGNTRPIKRLIDTKLFHIILMAIQCPTSLINITNYDTDNERS